MNIVVSAGRIKERPLQLLLLHRVMRKRWFVHLDYRTFFPYFAHTNANKHYDDNNLLLILEAFALSYLIGSLPTAYIVVKRKSHIDIRSAGSGNVGTLNAYEVTGERLVGIVVLAVDVLKGSFAVLLTAYVWGLTFDPLSASLVGIVIGHCFPVWLKFKGGRGLAAAAGAMLVVSWIFVAMWLVCWFVGYFFSKNIHVGNIVAIIASPLLGYVLPKETISEFTTAAFSAGNIRFVYCVMSLVLFIRHLGPLRELITSQLTGRK